MLFFLVGCHKLQHKQICRRMSEATTIVRTLQNYAVPTFSYVKYKCLSIERWWHWSIDVHGINQFLAIGLIPEVASVWTLELSLWLYLFRSSLQVFLSTEPQWSPYWDGAIYQLLVPCQAEPLGWWRLCILPIFCWESFMELVVPNCLFHMITAA